MSKTQGPWHMYPRSTGDWALVRVGDPYGAPVAELSFRSASDAAAFALWYDKRPARARYLGMRPGLYREAAETCR